MNEKTRAKAIELTDDLAMHLACKHGHTDDAGNGYSFSMEEFDDFVHAFVYMLPSVAVESTIA